MTPELGERQNVEDVAINLVEHNSPSRATSPKTPMPPSIPTQESTSWLPAQSWKHFFGGGLGGMCGAIVTSPFDVVKTRLQSNMFQVHPTSMVGSGGAAVFTRSSNLFYHFVETGHILQDIYKKESPSALFKGLGPSLVGVVPARSLSFFTYGNGKQIIANRFNNGEENPLVHLTAASIAGICTSTATNPIWVVKTRMQLSASQLMNQHQTPASSKIQGSWVTIKDIWRHEGVPGFYKGLTASYLGVTEGTIQWVLYERLKKLTKPQDGSGGAAEWLSFLGSAGTSKCVASLCTYPHEVIRTRIRQPAVNGTVKYTGLYQTLRLVIHEEGVRSLYGGLSAHLMRVVPNAAVMFFIYEGILRW